MVHVRRWKRASTWQRGLLSAQGFLRHSLKGTSRKQSMHASDIFQHCLVASIFLVVVLVTFCLPLRIAVVGGQNNSVRRHSQSASSKSAKREAFYN